MYNTSEKPNLKPFRSVNPYDVVNFFAHEEASVNKGTFVKLKGGVDPDATPMQFLQDLEGVPSRAKSMRAVNPNKVETAASGDRPFGMLLYDVREENKFGEKYIYRPRYDRSEQQIVTSGESVPIVQRGIFEINGFSGAPDAGSGAVMHSTVDGQLVVVNKSSVTDKSLLVGTFLSQSGADGYALFQLEL
jgi:hypothetical protein